MKQLNNSSRQFILDIFESVKDMTLATVRPDGYPQATTVSYAHDGLTLYIGISLDSQKAHNILHCNKVSLAVTPAYQDWNHIKGLSIGGIAEFVDAPDETRRVSECMLKRFPQISTLTPGTTSLPWAGVIFVRISPQFISVLNYEKGFGHTDLFSVT